MKLTIDEIARRAQVSKATVSRVMNQSKPVSADLKRRVLAVIEDTAFRPNLLAKSLSSKRSYMFGMVLPRLSNAVFARIVAGAEEALRKTRTSLLIAGTDLQADTMERHLDLLYDRSVDALILLGDQANRKCLAQIQAFHKPLALIDSSLELPHAFTVGIDDYQAAYEMAEALYDMGHRRLAMIHGDLADYPSGQARRDGFVAFVEAKGLPAPRLYEGQYDFESGYAGAQAILNGSEAPTAIFCGDDRMAVGAMKAAFDLKLRVPEDLSIAGFDDSDLARMLRPSLSTVRQNFEEKGQLAVEALLAMQDAEELPPARRCLRPYELVLRESTGVLGSKGPCP